VPYAVFARQSAGGAAPEASQERLLNWFAEPFPTGGTAPLTLLPSAGLSPWVTGATGPVRALYAQGGIIYAAAGGVLYQITAGVAVNLGAITDSAQTTITGNGFDVAVAAGGTYYVWNGTTLTTPTTGAFDDVGSVAGTSAYVVLFEQSGQRFSVTALNDASTVDALDFASAEVRPDGIVRGIVDHGDLWIFGTRTTEIWANTGDATFPFARYSGGAFERGLAWGNAVVSADNGVWWVADDRVVYRGSAGGQPQRVSTSRVEAVLAQISDGQDVRMLTFDDRGHKMVAVVLPDRPAWVYDLSTGVWHERSSGIGEAPWIATDALTSEGVQILGGTDGAIHLIGGLTDGGLAIQREAISAPLDNGGERLRLAKVKLHFGQGRTDIGRRPVAMVAFSRDGQTWDDEREIPLGLLGEYGWKSWINGAGRAYQFSMRVRITDPIDAPFLGVSYAATA
jgi:hypothetical protein